MYIISVGARRTIRPEADESMTCSITFTLRMSGTSFQVSYGDADLIVSDAELPVISKYIIE